MATSHGGPLAVALQDLQHIFGERLHAVVAYGRHGASPAPCLALVRTITADDLDACAARLSAWQQAGCATPLLLTRDELSGSLDAFPIEYGEIIDAHTVLVGADPFAGVQIAPRDLRRALEAQTASHLIHLRENFMEAGGRPAAVAVLVRDSAPGFFALLRRLARLDGAQGGTATELAQWATARAGLDARVVGDVIALATEATPAVDPVRLFPDYLRALEALLAAIDQWPVS